MRLKDLDVHRFKRGKELIGLAFLCPCCKKEYLTCFFKETPYEQQREYMKDIVSDLDGATWVPSPAFNVSAAANENDLDQITIRPAIDARSLGHALVMVSHGEVSH